jgi:predicted nuclease of restriction endonuclease-like (RecB) superfamily
MKIEKLFDTAEFEQIVRLIEDARSRALRQVNAELVILNYQIGQIVSERVENGVWGEKTVDELADFIKSKMPELKGFTRRGLYRMKQFYETYLPDSECYKVWFQTRQNKPSPIVSTVLTQLQDEQNQQDAIVSAVPTQLLNTFLSEVLTKISWSNHLKILSATKNAEEKIFYLMLSAKENLSFRELERQIQSSAFERTILSDKKMTLPETILPRGIFKDKYIFEFLDLPDGHSETDLELALIENFKNFVLEIGRGFAYLGRQFRLQVGNHDYYLDLLFYQRDLQCLVNFELKIKEFKPEFLGKLNFYLEALDRDVKKTFENPSIGVLLCKGKDETVVEYALARNVSPALIADYETKLPDKKLLQAKIEEFAQILESAENKD